LLEPTAGSLEIEEDALLAEEAPPGDAVPWWARALDLIRRARAVQLQDCITLASAPDLKQKAPSVTSEAAVVKAAVRAVADGSTDLTVIEGDRWSAIPSRTPCAAPAPAPAPPAR
jgi:hypothetical protein